MDLLVKTPTLLHELRRVERIAATKPTRPILGYTLLHAAEGQLDLSTSNLDIGLTTSCPAQVTQAGDATLPVKRLLDLVGSVTAEEVHLLLNERGVHLRAGDFAAHFPTLPVEDFPHLPQPSTPLALLAGPVLRTLLRKVRRCVNEADGRYFLNGVLLVLTETVIAAVATDGTRLAVATAPYTGTGTTQVIVPLKTVDALLQDDAPDLGFTLSENQLFFTTETSMLSSLVIDGKFPKYQQMIPAPSEHPVTVARTDLLAAVKRLSWIAETTPITLSVEPQHLYLSSARADVGQADERIAVGYDGPPVKIRLSWVALRDFLELAIEDHVRVSLQEGQSSVLLSDGSDYIGVILLSR